MEKEFPMSDSLQYFLERSRQLFMAALFGLVFVSASVLVPSTSALADVNAEESTVTVEKVVNINTADAEALALALDGVGMSRARDIIAYREQHGDFTMIEQLTEVRGIGAATLERNRHRIILVDLPE
jgi:competence protein ComEA